MNKPHARDTRTCIMCQARKAMKDRYYCNECLQVRSRISREHHLRAAETGLVLHADYKYRLEITGD